MEILLIPSPWHDSQRPPFTLKENLPLSYPRSFASRVCANRSRMSSNTPVYVAGLDRGVRPIGSCPITTSLSIFSSPWISRQAPGFTRSFPRACSTPFVRTSVTREDLPDPETPVTTVRVPRRIVAFTPLRLFWVAFTIFSVLPLPFLRFTGTGMERFPERYWPVTESGQAMTSSGVPALMISPP